MAKLTLLEAVKMPRMKALCKEGTILAIDPSSGGSSSPGFCLVKDGVLQDYGILRIPKSTLIHARLHHLAESMRRELPIADMLIIEDIPPFMQSKGTSFRNASVNHLHYSVGVTLSCQPWPVVVHLTPQSWHAYIRSVMDEAEYVKSDETDALCIMTCFFERTIKQKPKGVTLDLFRQKGMK